MVERTIRIGVVRLRYREDIAGGSLHTPPSLRRASTSRAVVTGMSSLGPLSCLRRIAQDVCLRGDHRTDQASVQVLKALHSFTPVTLGMSQRKR